MSATLVSTEPVVRGIDPRQRYRSLDGLRGLAAFTVLCCHALIVAPSFMQGYADPSVIGRHTGMWWATFSPLHLGWAGTEAVYLFFVLSGFVLTLPFAGSGHGRWPSYYPKRLLRLYVPVWGAFMLTTLWMTVLPRHFAARGSVWLQSQVGDLSGAAVKSDLLLTPGLHLSNGVVWSLTFEVMFSILLPIYIFAGKSFPQLNLLKFVVLLGLIVNFGNVGSTPQFFLPMFGLGTIMALERRRLGSLGYRIRRARWGRFTWMALTALSLVMLNAYWTVWGITTDPKLIKYLVPASRGISLLGACIIIFAAIEGPVRHWLERPVLQWLGTRSFSLYLVHVPIILVVATVLGDSINPWLSLAIGIPFSLAVAEAFHLLVERPSQKLSRAVEKAMRPSSANPAKPAKPAKPLAQQRRPMSADLGMLSFDDELPEFAAMHSETAPAPFSY